MKTQNMKNCWLLINKNRKKSHVAVLTLWAVVHPLTRLNPNDVFLTLTGLEIYQNLIIIMFAYCFKFQKLVIDKYYKRNKFSNNIYILFVNQIRSYSIEVSKIFGGYHLEFRCVDIVWRESTHYGTYSQCLLDFVRFARPLVQ